MTWRVRSCFTLAAKQGWFAVHSAVRSSDQEAGMTTGLRDRIEDISPLNIGMIYAIVMGAVSEKSASHRIWRSCDRR